MTPTIRQATEEDIPQVLELYRELAARMSHLETTRSASPDDYRRAFAEIRSDPRHQLLVAEQEGEIVGTVVLLIVPNLSHSATPWAAVENLVVTEKHRRTGCGRLLLEHAIGRAREEGCHRIQLCSSREREEAHRLYREVGFEPSAYGFRIYF